MSKQDNINIHDGLVTTGALRLFACMSVCVFALKTCAMFTSYITMQLQYIAAFGGLHAKLQQIKVVVLPRWRQHGRELIFVVYS